MLIVAILAHKYIVGETESQFSNMMELNNTGVSETYPCYPCV
jgi:hypothetical protein